MSGSTALSPPRAGRGVPKLRPIVLVPVIVALATTAFIAADFNGLRDWLACPHTCPSDFAPVNIERAATGTSGCQEPPGTVCYKAEFDSAIQGLSLSGLRFNVAFPRNDTIDPNAPGVPLGPSAAVSALGENGEVVGVWSMHSLTWQSGSNWPVPTTSNTTVVLDTGLRSNASLSDAYFFVILNGPSSDSLGFPLFCGGC